MHSRCLGIPELRMPLSGLYRCLKLNPRAGRYLFVAIWHSSERFFYELLIPYGITRGDPIANRPASLPISII